jgi:hypothetical protein
LLAFLLGLTAVNLYSQGMGFLWWEVEVSQGHLSWGAQVALLQEVSATLAAEREGIANQEQTLGAVVEELPVR